MAQITTYSYDAGGGFVQCKSTDGHGWLDAPLTAKCGWELEGATHIGECEAPQAVTIWLRVRNGVIVNSAYHVPQLAASANALCHDIRGMTIEEVKMLLDNQPADQAASRSVVAAALAAAIAAAENPPD